MHYGRTLKPWAFALALLMIVLAPVTPDATPGQIHYVKSEIDMMLDQARSKLAEAGVPAALLAKLAPGSNP